MSRLKWIIAGLALGVALCVPLLQRTSEDWAWQRSRASLRRIAEALHGYHSIHGELPPAVVRGKEGTPLYSWRVALLPYLEQDALFRKLRPDEPWDSAHNLPLLQETPRSYLAPSGIPPPRGMTHFQAFVGPGTAFEPGATWEVFEEGKPNRILVVEATNPVPWAKPDDLIYDPIGPIPPLGRGLVKPVKFLNYDLRYQPGFNACFSDGRSRFIEASIPEAKLRTFITGTSTENVGRWALE